MDTIAPTVSPPKSHHFCVVDIQRGVVGLATVHR